MARATCEWASDRTLTPSRSARASTGQVVDVRATHTETSGGSRDTEVNELAAMPIGCPSTIEQAAVTPLGKHAKARRRTCGSSGSRVGPSLAGEFFRTRGPLNTMPGPQRRPVICQAGGSPAGKAFGAAHADTIIAQSADVEAMRRYRDDITDLALAAGRDPKSIKILFSVSPIVDADADAAAERAEAAAAARGPTSSAPWPACPT